MSGFPNKQSNPAGAIPAYLVQGGEPVGPDNPLSIGTVDVTVTDVTLDAGDNLVGKVGIDQVTPGANEVVVAGDTPVHITTATTTTVAGAHTLKKVIVNSLGTIASTVTLKDGATTLAVIDTLSTTGRAGTYEYDIACATSIVVVTTGTIAPDVTVTYH